MGRMEEAMTPEQFEEFASALTEQQFDQLAELIEDALELQVQNHHRARQKGRLIARVQSIH